MTTVVLPMTVDESSAESRKRDVSAVVLPPQQVVDEIVHLLKLLGDETRIRILYFLQQAEELNVRELCRLLRQRQPSVSHHLALLRVAGLIHMRRDGKHNYYQLVPTRLEQLIQSLAGSELGQPARVCFEGFELRYTPHLRAAPSPG